MIPGSRFRISGQDCKYTYAWHPVSELIDHRPGKYKQGGILTLRALSERTNRFRAENSVAAWTERRGTDKMWQSIWDRMSPAAQLANSTRELSKVAKAKQEEAEKPNAGKHSANAAGRARSKKGRNGTGEEVSGPANAQEDAATQSASLRSGNNGVPRSTFESDYSGNQERQPQTFALEQGRQTHPNKRQKIHESTPSIAYAAHESYPKASYGDAYMNPFLDPDLANYNHGSTAASSDTYSVLPAKALSGSFIGDDQRRRIREGPTPSAGAEAGENSLRTLGNAHLDSQYISPVVEAQHAHLDLVATQNWEVALAKAPTSTALNAGSTLESGSPFVQHPHNGPAQLEDLSTSATPLTGSYPDFDSNPTWQTPMRIDIVEQDFSSTSHRMFSSWTNQTGLPAIHQETDYRSVLPQSEQDMDHIQDALFWTKANYFLRSGRECPPTARHQSYSFQVKELLDSFAVQWVFLGYPSPIPDLVTSREPWRNGLNNWVPSTGVDEAWVDAHFDLYGVRDMMT